MVYYYSTQKLLITLLIRFLPSLLFLCIALKFGEVFWVGVVVLWLEAIIEVLLLKKSGYRRISENQIETLHLVLPKKLKLGEIKSSYVYNNEWTFRSTDTEIRIQKGFVKKSQWEDLEKQLTQFREKVNEE